MLTFSPVERDPKSFPAEIGSATEVAWPQERITTVAAMSKAWSFLRGSTRAPSFGLQKFLEKLRRNFRRRQVGNVPNQKQDVNTEYCCRTDVLRGAFAM
ncbi:hypothetical protein ACFWF7_19185 [Nocardia sp. NPDC060256]|uniref:hypothetical protein n=1 Tax=unclassified Nocardia TaxID=2637762 RepID=UPI0036517E7B